MFTFRAFFSTKLGRLKLGIEAPYTPERLQDSKISCGSLPLNNSFGEEKKYFTGILGLFLSYLLCIGVTDVTLVHFIQGQSKVLLRF